MKLVKAFVLSASLLVVSAGWLARAQMPMLPDTGSNNADPSVTVPDFDVASVKPHKADDNMMRVQTKPDGFAATNFTLSGLINFAYGIRPDLISGGPGWVTSTRFDVDAKVADADVPTMKKLTQKQRRDMLAKLLEERFKLQVHHETKEMQVYELVVSKGGVKMKPAAPEPPPGPDAGPDGPRKGGAMMRMAPGELSGQNLTMSSVASQLAGIVQSEVIDKTGLSGKYDLDLKWTREQLTASSNDNGSSETAPSIFTAVQEQLGLKLQAAKGPVQTLVIDHAELPAEN